MGRLLLITVGIGTPRAERRGRAHHDLIRWISFLVSPVPTRLTRSVVFWIFF
jgi:hypothetical protein